LETCGLILKHVLKKHPTDNFGFTPKDLAHGRAHEELLKLLDNEMIDLKS
jgi:hypothetical protein